MNKLPLIFFIHLIIIKPMIGNAKKSPSMEHSRMVDSLSRGTEEINKVTSSLLHSPLKKTEHSQPKEKSKENSFSTWVGSPKTASI